MLHVIRHMTYGICILTAHIILYSLMILTHSGLYLDMLIKRTMAISLINFKITYCVIASYIR